MTKHINKIFWGLGIFAFILFIIALAPIYIYIKQFGNEPLTTNYEILGTFGDFIGGSTSAIIGLLNIIATIVLALVIKQLDDNKDKRQTSIDSLRHKQNLEFQNNLLIRSIREEKFKEFNRIGEKFLKKISLGGNVDELKNEVTKTVFNYIYFTSNNQHVFLTFRDKKHIRSIHSFFKPINDHLNKTREMIDKNPDLDLSQESFPEHLFYELANNINTIRDLLMSEILTNKKIPPTGPIHMKFK